MRIFIRNVEELGLGLCLTSLRVAFRQQIKIACVSFLALTCSDELEERLNASKRPTIPSHPRAMRYTESTRATSKHSFEGAEVYAPRCLGESCVVGVSHVLKSFGRLLTDLNATTSA
jgi:hypothetical protein